VGVGLLILASFQQETAAPARPAPEAPVKN
jgi:hypothetical protein